MNRLMRHPATGPVLALLLLAFNVMDEMERFFRHHEPSVELRLLLKAGAFAYVVWKMVRADESRLKRVWVDGMILSSILHFWR